MYCRSCLAANPDGAQKCAQCGAPLTDAIPPPMQGGPRIDLDAEPAATPGGSKDPGPTMPQTPKPPADDFNLAPEQEKKADVVPPAAPPEAPEEKKEGDASKPPMPKDQKQNAIIFLVVLMCTTPVTFCFCCCVPFPNMIGLVFAVLALLEANKVKALYEADDFLGAETASKSASKYLKIGVIVTAVMFMTTIAWKVLNLILAGSGVFKNILNRGG